jgi:hypothetical protein
MAWVFLSNGDGTFTRGPSDGECNAVGLMARR